MDQELGSLKEGRVANVLVTDGPLFEASTHVVEHWVAGKATSLRDRHPLQLGGTYTLTMNDSVMALSIKGEPGSWKATWMVNDTTEKKVSLSLDNRTVVLGIPTDDGPIRLTGNVWMESRSGKARASWPTATGTMVCHSQRRNRRGCGQGGRRASG